MALPLMVDAASVFIMKQFFDTVPVSIEEAARMVGAPTLQTFWYVVLSIAPGAHHADDPVVPGVVGRVQSLPRDDELTRAQDAPHRPG